MRNILSTLALALLSTAVVAQGLVNLGPNINDPNTTDCYPCIAPDGRTLYFSRDMGGGKGYQIMQSTLQEDDKWGPAREVPALNNAGKNVVYNISPDGNTIVLVGEYGATPKNDGLSFATRTATGWSAPTRLNVERYDNITWGNNAVTFSTDRKVMVVSLSGDLHVSYRIDDEWSYPEKLPENVNTSTYEYTPFMASDNKTLYFSSSRSGGMGGNDIYKITRLDNSWKKWSDPENLGEPVNSSKWESFFAIDAQGTYAYVYSLSEGDGDLFRVKLKDEQRPEPVVVVEGRVLDSKTKKPLAANIGYERLSDGEPVGEASTNAETGSYQIVLQYGENYGFSANAEGYVAVSENMDLSTVADYQKITRDLLLTPIEVGQTVRMNNLFFDVAKTTLRPASYPELERVAKMMKMNTNMVIEISGHTDSDGSEAYNQNLSEGRANAVRDYLVKAGEIAGDRITAKGYGESQPVVKNDSDANKQRNRRVEFTITKN